MLHIGIDLDNTLLDATEAEIVYRQYGHEIHWQSEPLPHALDVMRDLYDRHRITLITSRPWYFRDVTLQWLRLYGIEFHDIVFAEEKLQECERRGIDVLIDDGPHYAREFVRAGRPFILMDQPYNAGIAGDCLYRVADWLEVRAHLEILRL